MLSARVVQQSAVAEDDSASRSIHSDARKAAHAHESASGKSWAGQLPVLHVVFFRVVRIHTYTYGQETPEVPQMLVLLLSLGSSPLPYIGASLKWEEYSCPLAVLELLRLDLFFSLLFCYKNIPF